MIRKKSIVTKQRISYDMMLKIMGASLRSATRMEFALNRAIGQLEDAVPAPGHKNIARISVGSESEAENKWTEDDGTVVLAMNFKDALAVRSAMRVHRKRLEHTLAKAKR